MTTATRRRFLQSATTGLAAASLAPVAAASQGAALPPSNFRTINSEEQLSAQLLAPANLPYAAETPDYFVRGNHDVRGVEARALARFVDVPTGQWFYSFRQGPVAFVVLDTGEDNADDHPAYAGLGMFDPYRTR